MEILFIYKLIYFFISLIYGYECQHNRCVKVELNENNFNKAIGLPVCRMFCDEAIGTLWPKPSGKVKIEQKLMRINRNDIHFNLPSIGKQSKLWDGNKERFMNMLEAKIPNVRVIQDGGYKLVINVNLEESINEEPKLTLDTDESYVLKISGSSESGVQADINANNFFGARYAMETLAQLIVYDDIRRELQMLASAEIHDAPAYKWRGLLLDTSRNFFSVKSIKRTLGK